MALEVIDIYEVVGEKQVFVPWNGRSHGRDI
jgi:hypothetical protein